jgi:hypothetical protein
MVLKAKAVESKICIEMPANGIGVESNEEDVA